MQKILQWVKDNPFLVSLVVWPLITAILTTLTRKRTPAEWELFNMQHPYLANVVRILRAAGLDLPKLLKTFADIFLAQAEKKIGPRPPTLILSEEEEKKDEPKATENKNTENK